MKTVWRITIFCVVLAALLSLGGIAAAQTTGEPSSIYIRDPTNNSTVMGPNVTVKVDVGNFNLVPPGGKMPVPGQGQIIYYLDMPPRMTPGQPAIPNNLSPMFHMNGQDYAISDKIMHTFGPVTPGEHNVSAML
ncbi:MAG TPA: hypothetical protein VE134_02335, partial [Methanomicrobiales archaeon]|nr:hypothetical protein [Methanomicrobiales archaeon]